VAFLVDSFSWADSLQIISQFSPAVIILKVNDSYAEALYSNNSNYLGEMCQMSFLMKFDSSLEEKTVMCCKDRPENEI
jgi:hypothetical protein